MTRRAHGTSLDRARAVGDPPADALVRELGDGRDLWAANAVLRGVAENGEPLPAALPEALRSFLEERGRLPAWADPEKLCRGAEWAERHVFFITASLFCASLPLLYAGAKGAAVVHATRRMNDDIDRRVNETGRFVFDVIEVGGFSPRGRAVRSIQKVRLVHAAVRRLLAQRRAAEAPINQEDLLGTLFGFSIVVLRSVSRLGAAVSIEDEEAFYHLWRVAGALLGIREELLPASAPEARALAERIAERQLAPSPAGRALTADLIAAMERHMGAPLLRPVPRALMHHLLGEEVCDVLGIQRGPDVLAARSVWTAPVLGWLSRNAPAAIARAGSVAGKRFLEAMMAVELEGKEPAFRMPAALGERWDLTSV